MKSLGKRGVILGVTCLIVVLVIVIGVLVRQVKVDEEHSPQLTDVEVTSYNEGSEESQFVQVDLIFDREIKLASETCKNLRITISGNRVQEGEYSLQAGENEQTAQLVISVDAITEGILKIEKLKAKGIISEIRSTDSKYAAQDFSVEAIIPSGVILSTVESEEGKVVKNVDSVWNIRSIAWIGLLENGELIPVSETRTLEMLDGRAAVHGHEFLMENEKDIAKAIVETLENNYGTEYQFSCDGTQVTVEKLGSDVQLDLEIYQYKIINGETVQEVSMGEEAHEEETNEHEDGLKIKQSEINREPTEEEEKFLSCLHISQIASDGITDGSELYQTITITGSAMPEEQIYSVRDLEGLIQLSFQNENMNQLGLPMNKNGLYGLDFSVFLDLCGADLSDEEVMLLLEYEDGKTKEVSYTEATKGDRDLFLSLASDADTAEENYPVLSLLLTEVDKNLALENLKRVTVACEGEEADPEYRYHNYGGYKDSKDTELTIEIYQKGAEYLGVMKSYVFTTEEIEDLMRGNPEAVVRNYYGTIGNEEFFTYMGVGGWLDYFEGISLEWLLSEQAGISSLDGYAELVGRDGEIYSTIEDLTYISKSEEAEEYYILTSDGVKIPGCIPMIATVKNGRPMLPEHDHESETYIAYNKLNERLETEGVVTEIGVVKNHNGPFAACLGNRDGYYGGNQIETGGDCVLIRLYLNEY
ncbi:MAG: hypothetical protein J5983_04260 [Ruminococcus sp.]|nr:hypothetical protein [Ruminococcus sp.]